MKFPLWVGVRLATARKGTRFLSFITKVSVLGLMLGVAALIVVVSIMNGFDSQLKYRILGAVPHMVVAGDITQVDEFNISQGIVKGSAPFLQAKGMLIAQGRSRLVTIYGIEPTLESHVSILPKHMDTGGAILNLQAGKFEVMMGSALAAHFGLLLQDNATLLIPLPSERGQGVVSSISQIKLIGSFTLNSELDYGLVLLHLEDLKALTHTETAHTRVTLNDIFAVNTLKAAVDVDLEITDWTQEYGNFFQAVRMEKIMMFVLLTLVVVIAAFNTVSGLNMLVQDMQAEIAVLRTMGLSCRNVILVFVFQGSLIGLLGVVLGMILGVPLAYYISEVIGFFEDILGIKILAGTYFDRVPTDVRVDDLIIIGLMSGLICVLATLYPAYRSAKVEPATVLGAA